jgi:hypothetical protein
LKAARWLRRSTRALAFSQFPVCRITERLRKRLRLREAFAILDDAAKLHSASLGFSGAASMQTTSVTSILESRQQQPDHRVI